MSDEPYTYQYNEKTGRWDVFFHGVFQLDFPWERLAKRYCHYANMQR